MFQKKGGSTNAARMLGWAGGSSKGGQLMPPPKSMIGSYLGMGILPITRLLASTLILLLQTEFPRLAYSLNQSMPSPLGELDPSHSR